MSKIKQIRDAQTLPSRNGFMHLKLAHWYNRVNQLDPYGRGPIQRSRLLAGETFSQAPLTSPNSYTVPSADCQTCRESLAKVWFGGGV